MFHKCLCIYTGYKYIFQVGKNGVCESRSVVSDCLRPHELYSPWNSPGQNTGVVAFPFLRGSSQPRDRTQVSNIPCIGRGVLVPPGKSFSVAHSISSLSYICPLNSIVCVCMFCQSMAIRLYGRMQVMNC